MYSVSATWKKKSRFFRIIASYRLRAISVAVGVMMTMMSMVYIGQILKQGTFLKSMIITVKLTLMS